MKAILVVDVPVFDDGRHLCNECPIWNRDRFLCEYDFNMGTKGCPLKPMPEPRSENYVSDFQWLYKAEARGWNECLEELENG